MKIHSEGYKIIIYSILTLALLNTAIIYFFTETGALWITVLALSIIILLFTVFFFRSPKRNIHGIENDVLAPADGRIVAIEEMDEEEYFKEKRLQLSVFMSLLNVHSNTFPVSGTVKYVRYHPGRFYPANHPKSSSYNERMSIVVETEDGREIMIRQVAGFIARRIVTRVEPGMKVNRGDELGFIKFGSRVDLFLPPGTHVNARLLQSVRSNRDVLAVL